MQLSIVIPSFNEAAKIRSDVEAAAHFMKHDGLHGEVIVVDDGGTDGTVQAARRSAVPEGVELRVLRHERNHGKGCAVRTGMTASRGRWAMFADSGLCVPYREARKGLGLLREGACEIAHGSRWLPESHVARPRGPYRRLASFLAARGIPALARTPYRLTDTQCGFKIYRGDVARELYGACLCDGFLFDVGVILRAVRCGYRIREFPIEWHSDPDSRFDPLSAMPDLLRQLVTIRRAVSGNQGQSPKRRSVRPSSPA